MPVRATTSEVDEWKRKWILHFGEGRFPYLPGDRKSFSKRATALTENSMTHKETSGRILHLQRLSTEDGPGIRTTIFFKGCPLRCWWCHNPESLSTHVQVQWLAERCIDCGTCLETCPNGCLSHTPQGIMIDRDCCQGCGACADACPANAMERLGRWVGVDELLGELLKDRTFYGTSGGGVTASGGEPMLQPDFIAAIFKQLQAQGVHTALDTCGNCSQDALAKVLPHVDLILFDLKEIDLGRHRMFTGVDNLRILSNLHFVRDTIAREGHPDLWIRTPLIPGATASRENIEGLGRFIAEELDGVIERWELCAFNNLCRDKYARLDMPWRYADIPLLTAQELHEWEVLAKDTGLDPIRVQATGATQVA